MIWTAISAIIPWEWIAGAGAALVALLGAWVARKRSGAVRAENRGLRANEKQHERMNNADTGIGATDDERVKRLRDFAAKHGG